MALSGSVKTNSYSGRYYQVDWTATQSVANNTSTISWTLKCAGGTDAWYAERTVELVINGSTAYSKTAYVERRVGNITSGSLTVSHDTNGNKSFSISLKVACYYAAVNLTGSGTFALNNIPRKSTLSVANGTLGTAQTLTVTRQSTNFTHSIIAKCGSSQIAVCTKSSSTSISFTPPVGWASQNTTGTSLSVTYTIITFNGSSTTAAEIGSNSYSRTCTIPANVKPTLSISVSDAEGYSGVYGGYVQGKSRLSVAITASGAYGSSIKSYSTTADGNKYTAASFTTSTIKGKGTLSINATVTDSRGRTATATEDITVLEYNVPNVKKIAANRCNADGTTNKSGEYIKITFSASVTNLNNNNVASYTVQYKKTTDANYTTALLESYNDIYSVTDGSYIFPADTSSSYDITLIVSDAFGSSKTITSGSSISKLWSILSKGKGIAIGKIAEIENLFDINMPTKFRKPVSGKVYGLSTLDYIPENDDLNSYTESGCYSIRANVTAQTIANVPCLRAGRLIVSVSTGGHEVYNDNHAYIEQIYIPFNYGNGTSQSYKRYISKEGTDAWIFGEWYTTALDAYPVGSYYISHNDTSPAELFGGTWHRIESRFLWACPSTSTIGLTAGEMTHTLTVDEMPSHNHTLSYWAFNGTADSSAGWRYGIAYQNNTGRLQYATSVNESDQVPWGIQNKGGRAAHNNMPPYVNVAIWRRTA